MSDVVDMATEIQDEHLARSLKLARQPIAAGVAGECEQCFEDSPRLVGGRCAFCRDGRRRPPNPIGKMPKPVPPEETRVEQSVEEAPTMSKSVTFVADGAVLAEIRRRTADGTSNNRAALDLVEAGLAAMRGDPPAAPVVPVDLPSLAADVLIGEITRRLTSLVDAAAVEAADQRIAEAEDRASAAEERAVAAERKLDQLRAALAA